MPSLSLLAVSSVQLPWKAIKCALNSICVHEWFAYTETTPRKAQFTRFTCQGFLQNTDDISTRKTAFCRLLCHLCQVNIQ